MRTNPPVRPNRAQGGLEDVPIDAAILTLAPSLAYG